MCRFLPYINMDQPQIYICPLPLEPASHLLPYPTPLDCHRVLVWVSWIIQQIPTGYFTYVYVSMLLSPLSHQFWPINDQVVIEDQFVHSGLDSIKFIKFIIYKIYNELTALRVYNLVLYELILKNMVNSLDAKKLWERRGGARVTETASTEQT